MYVCVCNGYTDKEIKTAVRENGVKTAEEAYLSLGNGFCCGTCADCANDIVTAELPFQRVLAAE